jgi:hypothetical protein
MAERQQNFASVFTGALAKGLAGVATGVEQKRLEQNEAALTNYQLQQQAQAMQQRQQESQLRMTQMRLENQRINAELQKVTYEMAHGKQETPKTVDAAMVDAFANPGKYTPDQVSEFKKMFYEQNKIEDRASSGGAYGFTGEAANVMRLYGPAEGARLLKEMYNDKRFDPYTSEAQWQKYKMGVEARNAKILAANAANARKNEMAKKFPNNPYFPTIPDQPLEDILDYPAWAMQERQRLGRGEQTPIAPVAPPMLPQAPAPPANPFGAALGPPAFPSGTTDLSKMSDDELKKLAAQYGL